jgi:Leucine Rich Repeat (LRR) protein
MAALFVCLCLIVRASNDASLDAFLVRVEATPWPIETTKVPARVELDDDGNIVGLRLDGVQLTSEDIERITTLAHLERLSLNRTGVKDADLKKLATLRHLRAITLNQTGIGDEGIAALAEFPSLRTLCLGGVKATPQAVRALKAKNKRLQLGYFQSKD